MKTRTVASLIGWTCDRGPRGMRGAELAARTAAARLGLTPAIHGAPLVPRDLLWDDALVRAAPAFAAARAAVSAADGNPLVFANRCGTSLATIPALLARFPDAHLVWCDAHADYNTPASTPTGYLGGMVVAALCGLWNSGWGAGLAPDRVTLVGVRDIDASEAVLLKRDGVRLVPGDDRALDVNAILDSTGGRPTILHIDCDVMDRRHVPAEYDVPGGLHPEALTRLAGALRANGNLAALEIAEFEPTDEDGATERAIGHLVAIAGAALGHAAGSGLAECA